MSSILHTIGQGFANAGLMAWQVWWALVLGFLVSAVVQALVPRERVSAALAGRGLRPVALATGFGAASSSCSYAAVAIARSLFAKGASAAAALTFQIASTNLVWELGFVLWVLIGWQFMLGEYVGAIVMIGVVCGLLALLLTRERESRARRHAQQAGDGGHDHGGHDHGGHDHSGHDHDHGADHSAPRGSRAARMEIAAAFRSDWRMLYKEIGAGLLLAGFIGLLGDGFFRALFLTNAPEGVKIVENVIVGPLVAVLSFVCSVGNVPLAAVLWSGGISFAGVISFLMADLIVLPLIVIYRKYYGDAFALRITLALLGAIIVAALVTAGLFSLLGLIPTSRPSTDDVFGSISLNYEFVLNLLATGIFVMLMWTARLHARAGRSADRTCH